MGRLGFRWFVNDGFSRVNVRDGHGDKFITRSHGDAPERDKIEEDAWFESKGLSFPIYRVARVAPKIENFERCVGCQSQN